MTFRDNGQFDNALMDVDNPDNVPHDYDFVPVGADMPEDDDHLDENNRDVDNNEAADLLRDAKFDWWIPQLHSCCY